MKIMVVDGTPFTRMLEFMIKTRHQNVEIIPLSTGEEAILALEHINPGLVLTAHQLPDMSGLDLIKKLRQKKQGLKLGMISKGDSEDRRHSAKTAGAVIFLPLPTTRQDCLTALKPLWV